LTNDLSEDTQWDEMVQGMLTLFSDQNGPLITISSPLPGSTIIENPPQIVATIVDQDAGGRVNASSVSLSLDGVVIPATAFTFDATSGILTYNIPTALTVTSHTFTVSARDLSGNLSSATGNFRIAVPTLPAGVQTFSMPRWVTAAADNDPGLIFGRDNFTLVRWVPSLFGVSKYRTFPNSFAGFMPPDAAAGLNRPTVQQPPAGLGYWVRVRQARPVTTLPGNPVTLSNYPIVLSANPDGGSGWNMIANPFDVSAVGLASVQVQQSDGRTITFSQAIDQRLTPGVLFTYVPNSANPNATGRYDFQDAGEGQLTRLQGHWLRANSDFVMLVNNGSRQVAAPVAQRSEPSGGWRLTLQAQVGEAGWDELQVGASNGTGDGYDRSWDVAAPPPLPGGVELRAIHSDWGVDSGRYMRDLRGPAGGQVWELEVVAPAGEVTLTWPNLRGLPADLQLSLSDPTNGRSRALRSSSGYRFEHAGGSRSLRLTATRAEGGALALLGVTVTRGRGSGWGIGYTVSRAADVTAVVRSLSGRELASVVATSESGRGQLYWDGRTADGQPCRTGFTVSKSSRPARTGPRPGRSASCRSCAEGKGRAMHRMGLRATLLQLCLGGGVLAPVAAQTILGQNTQSFPPRNAVSVANQYLRLDMGLPEIVRTLRPGTGTPPGPATDIGYSNFRGGRVVISTVQGDPFTAADDGLSLVGGGAWSTYAAVRLGDPGLVGATTTTYEMETLQQAIDDPAQDIIVSQAEATGNSLAVGWQIRQGHTGSNTVQSRLTTVANNGLAGATTEPVMVVQQTYRLVRDMVRMEVACTNVSGAEQVAGVELFVDPQFGAGNNDGQPFFIGDVRQGVTREFLFPSANINDEGVCARSRRTGGASTIRTAPG